jgi:hypothetical protein
VYWGGTIKIKELFDFEDIQQVIQIGKIKDEEEIVKKFVISPNLEEDLLYFMEYLTGNKPEDNISLNVIGNYGTGKSHLLAFVSLILSKPELTKYIQNDKIRNAFVNLKKEFMVVKYELPPVQTKSLASIFFYRVKKQLKENYDIEIRSIDLEKDPKDPKELVEEILLQIKEKYPTKGLIVIFDEFSDFIKGKHAADQNHDLQFTRQLAESSANQDFILMLSMQEHIFSNPEYMDKAELIKKIEKRFLKINITSENIEDIIAKRIVSKNQNQIQELKKLFDGLKDRFDNIAVEEDRYIDLFPVHPYLIEIFSKLTFFENRSILQFISYQIKKMMDQEFPAFITYDLIYDEMIESELTVKNHPDVKPVVNIVDSLNNNIISRLDSKYRERAKRLVKSLAIKSLITPPNKDGEKKGGDTPEKFAENLFIIPKSKIIEPSADVSTILNMMIQRSEGGLINKDEKKDIYFINLDGTPDYEQVINNKASTMDDLQHINEKFVENFLLEELGFEVEKGLSYWDISKKYIIDDSVIWKDRNSFREGILALNIGYKLKFENEGDYLTTIKGYGSFNINETHPKHVIIKPNYDDDLAWSIKRLSAVEALLKTRTYPDVMKNKKRTIIDEELKKHFRNAFLNSLITYQSNDYSLDELGIFSDINAEIFSQIKEKLLGEDLTQEYPDYPRFKSKISAENIKGTVESVIRDISQKEGVVKDLLSQSTNLLIPLGLYKNGMLDVNESQYARKILDAIQDSSKNVAIEEIISEFVKKPHGLQKEVVYLIIAVLLRNGDLMLSSKHGKSYSSAEFSDLFKSGLKAFDEIKYIKKEGDIPPETHQLFDALDLDRSLLQISKNRPIAFRNYMDRIEEIERNIRNISIDFEDIKQSMEIGLPLNDIERQIKSIEEVNFESLKLNNINGFNNLDLSTERLKDIENAYELTAKIKSLFDDCNEFILPGMKYMKNAMEWIDNDYFKATDKNELNGIYDNSHEIIGNIRKLLKEDERKPLKGKIELFKEKYKEIYYHTHKEMVGEGVDWQSLIDLENSSVYKKLNTLKDVNSINATHFREIQLHIKNLKDIRCADFRVDELETSYHCHCMFPMGHYDSNIDQKIENLWEETSKLEKSWETQILDNIKENQDNINQLGEEETPLINKIISKNKISNDVDYETVLAINSLLEDIEIEDIDLDDLYSLLTSDKDTLKVDEFMKKVESFVENKIRAHNAKKVRVRIIKTFDD